MRWPFAVALLALAIGASFVEWWAGLAILAWIAAMFLWYRIGGW
jgi:hypothetical protein